MACLRKGILYTHTISFAIVIQNRNPIFFKQVIARARLQIIAPYFASNDFVAIFVTSIAFS